jgi:hypothetical protein
MNQLYEKAKDLILIRRTSDNKEFEEYPLIVQPQSVLMTDPANNVICFSACGLHVAFAVSALSASFANSASYAYSSSHALWADSSSYYISETSSALYAVSASYAQTASWAVNLVGGSVNAATSSYPWKEENGIISNADLSSNVGIGTYTPQSTLGIAGNVTIGAYVAATNSAPADGLLVEGNVSIGTINNANTLDVGGNVTIGADVAGGVAAPTNGLLVEGNVVTTGNIFLAGSSSLDNGIITTDGSGNLDMGFGTISNVDYLTMTSGLISANEVLATTAGITNFSATSIYAPSITGSLKGTASWAQNVVNGGNSASASYLKNANITIDTNGVNVNDPNNSYNVNIAPSNIVVETSADTTNTITLDATSPSITFTNDSSPGATISTDSSDNIFLNTLVSVNKTGGITGSLSGTASWATNVVGGGASTSVVLTNTASNFVILQQNTSSFKSAFYNYYVVSGSNGSADTVTAFWNGSNVTYNDVSSGDIGSTSDVNVFVALSQSFVQLVAQSTIYKNWTITAKGTYV